MGGKLSGGFTYGINEMSFLNKDICLCFNL